METIKDFRMALKYMEKRINKNPKYKTSFLSTAKRIVLVVKQKIKNNEKLEKVQRKDGTWKLGYTKNNFAYFLEYSQGIPEIEEYSC